MLILRGLALICLASYAIQAPDLETVLVRAGEYVQRYEPALGMMIAREEYVQRVPMHAARTVTYGLDGWARFAPLEYQTRRLVSDFLMVRLESAGDLWVGFRAVLEVNGSPVRDRQERLQEVLGDSVATVVERWRTLTEESASYNIGSVERSTNVPTFALFVLRDEHRGRFEFERIDEERVEGLRVWVIRYRETTGPAMIADRRGEDVFTHGRLWIDPVDGRLVRTEMRTGDEDSELRSNITVRYRPDDELGLWLPRDMKEHYESLDGRAFEATAEYSDFQQFNVSVETDVWR